MLHRALDLNDILERPTQRKMVMRVGKCNVRSTHRAGSLKTVVSELAKYNLDLMAVQKVRSFEGVNQPGDDYTFLCGNGNANHHLGTVLFVHTES